MFILDNMATERRSGVGWVKRVNRTLGIIHRHMMSSENDDCEHGTELNPTTIDW